MEDLINQASWGQNMMSVKRKLIEYKKKGLLFFEEDLSVIASHKKIEVYLYSQPSPKTKINAFPVPGEYFAHHYSNNWVDQEQILRSCFEKYYSQEINDGVGFSHYKNYIGEEFVWFYVRSEGSEINNE
ncbi:hypothetical protein BSK52_12600 [Paenibacillus odorifer]|uniref:Uncharacterized protein n=1 Tax=Paenibacillus odorifer TaxID=189426 RepID=A0A1R0Y033_9BACL|nr:hypothetical protein BSK52_12600 [Paenibacillus odorifer]